MVRKISEKVKENEGGSTKKESRIRQKARTEKGKKEKRENKRK